MTLVNGNGSNGNSFNLIDLTSQPEWKEMLKNVVKKESMDPWSVDISVLADKFMESVREMKQIDFRVPANAILAASILLRFKSDSWVLCEELDLLEPIYIPDSIISEPIFPTLEPSLRMTKRKVSLDELIDAIEGIMVKENKKKSSRRVVVNTIPQPLIDLMKQDGKAFEKRLEEVYERMRKTADKKKMTLFSNLIEKRSSEGVIENFVPMLHLANSQRIDVWQDEKFGEIFIQLLEGGRK